MLSFVFMQSLDLGIKQGIGIQLQPERGSNVGAESLLVRSLDLHEFGTKGVVLGKSIKLPQTIEIFWPTLANATCDKVS